MADIQQVTKTDLWFRVSWVRAPHSTHNSGNTFWYRRCFFVRMYGREPILSGSPRISNSWGERGARRKRYARAVPAVA